MAENNICGTGGCGCSATANNVSGEKNGTQKTAKKEINLEFLYLDLNVCEQCKGSESNLEEALAEVTAVLEKTGAAVSLKKIHVRSLEQAQAHGFISSPTIRLNGRDLALDVKENYCSSCSELSGTETFCRVWNFQGEEFSIVPKYLVVEAVLKEIYGAGKAAQAGAASPEQTARSLANLKRFFEGRAGKVTDANTDAVTREIIPPRAAQACCASGCGCS